MSLAGTEKPHVELYEAGFVLFWTAPCWGWFGDTPTESHERVWPTSNPSRNPPTIWQPLGECVTSPSEKSIFLLRPHFKFVDLWQGHQVCVCVCVYANLYIYIYIYIYNMYTVAIRTFSFGLLLWVLISLWVSLWVSFEVSYLGFFLAFPSGFP